MMFLHVDEKLRGKIFAEMSEMSIQSACRRKNVFDNFYSMTVS